MVAGAVWKLKGDAGAFTFDFAPLSRSMNGEKVSVAAHVDGPAPGKGMQWLIDNVEGWVPAFLTIGGKAGAHAAAYTVSNQAIACAPAAGPKFIALEITTGGGTPVVKSIDEALGLMGAAFSPFAPITGGRVAAPMVAVPRASSLA